MKTFLSVRAEKSHTIHCYSLLAYAADPAASRVGATSTSLGVERSNESCPLQESLQQSNVVVETRIDSVLEALRDARRRLLQETPHEGSAQAIRKCLSNIKVRKGLHKSLKKQAFKHLFTVYPNVPARPAQRR